MKSWFYDADSNRSEAFQAMGTAAVPFLVGRLEDTPSDRVMRVLDWFSHTHKVIYRQSNQMWQQRAAYLLGEMGSPAESAPSLSNAAVSKDWSVRGAATVALMKIRQESPAPLIEKLYDTSDSQTWYQNAMMVGQFGAEAEAAVPILLNVLQNSNSVIQAHALIALGMIGQQPEKCVPAVVPFLSSPSVGHRQKAIGTLHAFGTNALPARTAIEEALKDSDPWVKSTAEITLKKLSESDSPDDQAEASSP